MSVSTFFRQLDVTCRKQAALVQLALVRHKGSKRWKRPAESKEKERWTSRNKQELVRKKPHNFTNWVKRKPEDDVWLRMHYPRPSYSLQEALTMHRELAAPEMTDNKDGLLSLTANLDMSTKKKTKFIRIVSSTVRLPNFFEDGQAQRILALCKDEEEIELARESGAVFAGGADLIKSLQKAEVNVDEFDVAVCSSDMLPQIVMLRGVLKEKFPAKVTGAMQPDLSSAIDNFRYGKKYMSKRVTEAQHEISFAFGRLNQSDEELVENCAAFLKSLSSARPSNLGPFISQCMCIAPPSTERFLLHLRDLLPEGLQPRGIQNTVSGELEDDEANQSDSDTEQAEKA